MEDIPFHKDVELEETSFYAEELSSIISDRFIKIHMCARDKSSDHNHTMEGDQVME